MRIPGIKGDRAIAWKFTGKNPKESNAWVIGKIDKIEPLVSPIKPIVTENGPVRDGCVGSDI